MNELPVAQGLAVCELYIVDAATKNVTLVNQFTKMKSDTFPTDPKRFAVYATLVDGLGEVAMQLEVVQLSTADAIWQTLNRLRIPDRLTAVRYADGCHLSRTRRVRNRPLHRGRTDCPRGASASRHRRRDAVTADITSEGTILIEIEGRQQLAAPKPIDDPKHLLGFMIRHRRYFGTPLPDGYVPPPGIDIEALLKQLPPEPPKRSP